MLAGAVLIVACLFSLPSTPRTRSLREQSMHFFSRPNTGDYGANRSALLSARAAWRGVDLERRSNQWLHILSDEEQRDVLAAVEHATAALAARRAPLGSLRAEEFPLPALSVRLWSKTSFPAAST